MCLKPSFALFFHGKKAVLSFWILVNFFGYTVRPSESSPYGEVPDRRTLWAILGEAQTQNSDLEDLEKSEIRDPKSVFSNFLKSDWAS